MSRNWHITKLFPSLHGLSSHVLAHITVLLADCWVEFLYFVLIILFFLQIFNDAPKALITSNMSKN